MAKQFRRLDDKEFKRAFGVSKQARENGASAEEAMVALDVAAAFFGHPSFTTKEVELNDANTHPAKWHQLGRKLAKATAFLGENVLDLIKPVVAARNAEANLRPIPVRVRDAGPQGLE